MIYSNWLRIPLSIILGIGATIATLAVLWLLVAMSPALAGLLMWLTGIIFFTRFFLRNWGHEKGVRT